MMHVNDGISADASETELNPFEVHVLKRLESLCGNKGLPSLKERLRALVHLVGPDLLEFEQQWDAISSERDRVTQAGSQILSLRGKRLRPLCVMLATKSALENQRVENQSAERQGAEDGLSSESPSWASLAIGSRDASSLAQIVCDVSIAVELVHCATLLHDDVVDMSELRRGIPTARMTYGNAASIFAGDWLLIEALRRVEGTGVPGLLLELLRTIDAMIVGEAIQLENQGRTNVSPSTYFKIIEGKTGALFQWATYAGARVGGMNHNRSQALASFGTHLGIAFQLMDDLLDFQGDPKVTGKAQFADLREGKMTFPLIVALDRMPSLLQTLEAIQRQPLHLELEPAWLDTVLKALEVTGALQECQARATQAAEQALNCLAALNSGRARTALETVVQASLTREK